MNWRLSTFFFLQRMIGSRADLRYRDFLAMERWSKDRLTVWRENKIRALLKHAVEHVPYYTSRIHTPDAGLKAFPIITKDELHQHYGDMMTARLKSEYDSGTKPGGYGWLEVTSGGTTGVPTTVIHDADFRDMDRAARLYEQFMCGFPFGTKHVRLWGSMEDIQKTKASRSKRIMSWLANESVLNAFMMEDVQISKYIEQFKVGDRTCMIAYVDAIEQIAAYAENRTLELPAFTSIMTTGGTLTEETEQLLRKTFHARVHNKYGSRDCGELACACEHGMLHVLSPNVHIEILDDNNSPVQPGESGRVIVTFLGNLVFPIIRFDIGDIAIAGSDDCACGRPFPTIKRVTARTVDVIRSTSGGFITPVYIRHTIGVVHGQRKFRRYQFIQQDLTRYELIIQPENGFNPEASGTVISDMKKDLLTILGDGAELTIRFDQKIEETSGGKFRHVMNNYNSAS